MLGAGILTQARYVGCHEGKGEFSILFVFGQVEADSPHLSPERRTLVQKTGQSFCIQGNQIQRPEVEVVPDSSKNIGSTIFCSRHGRDVQGKAGKSCIIEGRQWFKPFGSWLVLTEKEKIACTKIAPEKPGEWPVRSGSTTG